MTLFETSGNFALVYADAAPQLAHPPGTNVLFVSAFTLGEKRGSALVPVAANKPFSVVGVDASTGLQSFAKLYDVNLAPGGPIGSPALPSPVDNAAGPYPVYASPARIELVDVPDAGITIASVRGLLLTAGANGLTIEGNGMAAGTR